MRCHATLARLRAADQELAGASDAELLTTVLAGTRPAPEVTLLAGRLARLTPWQRRQLGAAGLSREHGVAADRALRLAALWELAERWYPDERPAVSSPREAVLLLGGLREAPTEQVWVILLDSRHRPVRTETIAVGCLNSTRLTPRDALAPALRHGAAAFVVAHNHPSGDPSPSQADRAVTAALRNAADLVCVPLLDHIIVAAHGHHSFRDAEGWGSAAA
ncbi:MAG: JAB domain-containing protein [Candidatus Dormibacteria bacterium]